MKICEPWLVRSLHLGGKILVIALSIGLGAGSVGNRLHAEEELNAAQQKELLKISRATLEKYVREKKVPDVASADPKLKESRGVFVTLHRGGSLRGCIGSILPEETPLFTSVRNRTVDSAVHDPRFPPVNAGELDRIDIEISVLSLPKKVSDPEEIVMGKHGVIVRRGFQGGVFLPQVATETGWTREEFLSELCSQKAGLAPDAWKDRSTELSIFTAQVFGEKDLGRQG